jgi:hypothetical protein
MSLPQYMVIKGDMDAPNLLTSVSSFWWILNAQYKVKLLEQFHSNATILSHSNVINVSGMELPLYTDSQTVIFLDSSRPTEENLESWRNFRNKTEHCVICSGNNPVILFSLYCFERTTDR